MTAVALAVCLSLTEIAADLRAWSVLPAESVCEANYKAAWAWRNQVEEIIAIGGGTTAWNNRDLRRQACIALAFWGSAWWVTCSQARYPYTTWEQRREHWRVCERILNAPPED